MGDNRKNYSYTKCILLDNKGIALVTTIIIIAAILIISGAMLYFITRGLGVVANSKDMKLYRLPLKVVLKLAYMC